MRAQGALLAGRMPRRGLIVGMHDGYPDDYALDQAQQQAQDAAAAEVVRGGSDSGAMPGNFRVEKSAGGWVTVGSPMITTAGGRIVPDDGRLLDEFLTNDTVFTDINLIAKSVAGVPWRLFSRAGASAKRGRLARPVSRAKAMVLKGADHASAMFRASDDVEEVLEHPLLDLLSSDMHGLGRWQRWYATGTFLGTFGGCYWQMHLGAMGAPESLEVLPTQRLETVRSVDMRVTAYRYTPVMAVAGSGRRSGVQITIPENQVIPFRFPGVDDPWGGRQSPLRSAYRQSEIVGKYSDYQSSILSNRARIDGTFIPKEQMTKAESERAEITWNQKFCGAGNGRVLVADKPGTFVPSSYSPADVGELKITQNAMKRISDAYGVPEALLSKDATFANMQASLHLFAIFTTLPILIMMEESLNGRLVPLYDDPSLYLAADSPVQRDHAMDLQRTQVALGAGIITANEGRVALGFDKVEDNALADELPLRGVQAADETTEQGVPADDDGKDDVPAEGGKPPEAAGPGKPPDPEDEKDFEVHDYLVKLNDRVARGAMPRSVAIGLAAYAMRSNSADVKALIGFGPEKKLPIGFAAAAGEEGSATVTKGRVPGEAENTLTGSLREFFQRQRHEFSVNHGWLDAGRWSAGQRLLAALLLTEWQDVARDEPAKIGPKLGLATAQVQAAEKAALAAAPEQADHYAEIINTTTQGRVAAAVKAADEALPEGATEAARERATAAAADSVFADAIDTRAAVISADQLYRARMAAQIDAAKQSADYAEKIWVTAGDEKVCPYCGQLDGQRVAMDQQFENNLGAWSAPPAHVNCRCWLVFVAHDGTLVSGEVLED